MIYVFLTRLLEPEHFAVEPVARMVIETRIVAQFV